MAQRLYDEDIVAVLLEFFEADFYSKMGVRGTLECAEHLSSLAERRRETRFEEGILLNAIVTGKFKEESLP